MEKPNYEPLKEEKSDVSSSAFGSSAVESYYICCSQVMDIVASTASLFEFQMLLCFD